MTHADRAGLASSRWWLSAQLLRPARSEPMLVTSVIDGNTIEVQSIGRVRLLGIQAPAVSRTLDRKRARRSGTGATGQPGPAPVDSARTRRSVRPTASARRPAYVWTEDERLINVLLVREGLARAVVRANLTRRAELVLAEEQARAQRARNLGHAAALSLGRLLPEPDRQRNLLPPSASASAPLEAQPAPGCVPPDSMGRGQSQRHDAEACRDSRRPVRTSARGAGGRLATPGFPRPWPHAHADCLSAVLDTPGDRDYGSGDVGWVGLGASLADELSARRLIVVGVNIRQYLAAFTEGKNHLEVRTFRRISGR